MGNVNTEMEILGKNKKGMLEIKITVIKIKNVSMGSLVDWTHLRKNLWAGEYIIRNSQS